MLIVYLNGKFINRNRIIKRVFVAMQTIIFTFILRKFVINFVFGGFSIGNYITNLFSVILISIMIYLTMFLEDVTNYMEFGWKK